MIVTFTLSLPVDDNQIELLINWTSAFQRLQNRIKTSLIDMSTLL